MSENRNYTPFVKAGVVLGVGLGGFVDGIILHQILQWHHMLTSAGFPPTSVGNLEVNTLADGLFHATTWVITVIGLALLWQAKRHGEHPPTKILVCSIAIGWGLFNLVEGIIDHHILGIHHVRSGPDQLFWDLVFLALGAVMVVIGWISVRGGHREMPTE